MKLSPSNTNLSNNHATLGLLSVLLAFPAMTAAAAVDTIPQAGITVGKGRAREAGAATRRVLVDCDEADFLVEDFVVIEAGGSNSTEEGYEGCYEVADTLDDDLELSLYKIDGDLTAAGGAFYASDNNGGYDEPIWFFASVAEDTATQNVTDSFLCFDLDLNAAEDTHPADVTNWGLTIDGETSASRTCEFVTTCGCTVDDDDEEEDEEEEEADDEDAVDGDAGNSAFSVITATSSGNNFALIAGSACLLAFANGVRA